MSRRPEARRDGIIAEPCQDGLVLYDIDALEVHRLDPVAARVWRAANGRRGMLRLAACTHARTPTVAAALDCLDGHELLVTDAGPPAAGESAAAALAAWQ